MDAVDKIDLEWKFGIDRIKNWKLPSCKWWKNIDCSI